VDHRALEQLSDLAEDLAASSSSTELTGPSTVNFWMGLDVNVSRRFLRLATCGAVLAGGSIISSQDRIITLSVDDPRPLAAALQDLEARYGWVVTYDDPIYQHADELQDVTASVRRQDDATRPRVIVPRGGPFTFTWPPSSAPPAILENLLQAYNASGHPGVFRLANTGATFHVIPVRSRGADGVDKELPAVLDAPIFVPHGGRTAHELLLAIVERVSRATGVSVGLGSYPVNWSLQTQVEGAVGYEPARTALVRLLDSPRLKFSWRMFYAPDMKRYFLNIHIVSQVR
jgi:hypothetical protein